MEMSEKWIEENQVSILPPKTKNRTEILKFFNSKLCLFRETVLSTLKLEVENCGKPLLCLEADNGSGIAALQWKKHLGDKVQVIAAEKQSEKAEYGKVCNKNGLNVTSWTPDTDRTTGEWTKLDQGQDTLHASPHSANVLMHQEAFNFIYLHPNNSITPHVDAVFTNIRHNGVACFISPNIASQCFRCPLLIHRLYLAHVQKTEYVKEMAARIVIADIVRSATRHCRGIDVLYTVCFEDHLMVAIRVVKKTQAAVDCAQQIRPLLHCLMCEEKVVYPDTHSPVELPYSLLPCNCKDRHPGKTAVILGPMWVSDIFNVHYLQKLTKQTSSQFPNSKTSSLLQSIVREAICDNSPPVQNTEQNTQTSQKSELSNSDKNINTAGVPNTTTIDVPNADLVDVPVTDTISVPLKDTAETSPQHIEKMDTKSIPKRPHNDNNENDLKEKRIKLEGDSDSMICVKENKINLGNGDCIGDKQSNDNLKSTRQDGEDRNCDPMKAYKAAPLFYRNLHKQKYTGLPKSDKLVVYLQQAGYRASRTHFEDHAIRTNATARQLEEVIKKIKQQKN